MKVFGIAGYSGSGKTTLLEKLLPQLTARGLKVSVIKHAHHGFDIDRPGKDSYRHREAGATEVLLSCGDRWALMHERREEPEPTLNELLGHLSPCDLVLIEGFKREPHEKIEVWRSAVGKPLIAPEAEAFRIELPQMNRSVSAIRQPSPSAPASRAKQAHATPTAGATSRRG